VPVFVSIYVEQLYLIYFNCAVHNQRSSNCHVFVCGGNIYPTVTVCCECGVDILFVLHTTLPVGQLVYFPPLNGYPSMKSTWCVPTVMFIRRIRSV